METFQDIFKGINKMEIIIQHKLPILRCNTKI